MKLLINNINTNNHDHINDILGIAGLSQCLQYIDLCSGFIPLDVYELNQHEQQSMFEVIQELTKIGLVVTFKNNGGK